MSSGPPIARSSIPLCSVVQGSKGWKGHFEPNYGLCDPNYGLCDIQKKKISYYVFKVILIPFTITLVCTPFCSKVITSAFFLADGLWLAAYIGGAKVTYWDGIMLKLLSNLL